MPEKSIEVSLPIVEVLLSGEALEEEKQRKTLQRVYFGDSLANLLARKTPKEVVRTRPGRGKQQFRYVPVAWFIKELNILFGFNWDFEVLEHEIIKDSQIWVKGRLTVRGPNGIVVTKTQFGGSEVKKLQDGRVIDIADDLKSASSDCLKKCASLLGLAWDVYSGEREALTESGPDVKQLLTLYKRGDAAGMTMEEVGKWFSSQPDINPGGLLPEEAVEAEILGAISRLIQLAKEEDSAKNS